MSKQIQRSSFSAIFLLLILQNLYAAIPTDSENDIVNRLYQNTQWLALGHYIGKGSDSWESQIDDPNFFISENGSVSPKDELRVSIRHLRQENNTDFICHYPARYLFLKKHLPNLIGGESGNCPDLEKWLSNYSTDSISLVFPGSHISSPSSVFGHTFLRFDKIGLSKELSYAVEFSALVNSELEGMWSYVVKGINGGFKGIYSFKPYYVKTWEYADVEDRKIWEYKLKFSTDQINLLLLHLWELRGHYIDYYFIGENCSYQILALLSVANPKLTFRQEFSAFTLPSQTIKYLSDKQQIIESTFLPSYNDKIEHIKKSLSKYDIALLNRLTDEQGSLTNYHVDIKGSSNESSILKAARYILQHNMQSREIDSQFALERIKLITNLQLESKKNKVISIKEPVKVEDSHSPMRISIRSRKHGDEKNTLIQFRPLFNSFTDVAGGYDKHTEVEILKLDLIENEGDIHLNNFTVINLRSLKPVSNYSENYSWGIQIARKRLFLDTDLEAVNQISFEFGKTLRQNSSSLFLLSVSGLSYSSIRSRVLDIHAGIKTGLLHQSYNSSLLLELELVHFLDISDLDYKKVNFTYTHELARDLAFNVSIQSIDSKPDTSHAFDFGFAWYF